MKIQNVSNYFDLHKELEESIINVALCSDISNVIGVFKLKKKEKSFMGLKKEFKEYGKNHYINNTIYDII